MASSPDGERVAQVGFDRIVPLAACPGQRRGPWRAGTSRIGPAFEQQRHHVPRGREQLLDVIGDAGEAPRDMRAQECRDFVVAAILRQGRARRGIQAVYIRARCRRRALLTALRVALSV